MSLYFAERYTYPFADPDNLARVMQYAASVSQDTVELKHEVCTFLKEYVPRSTVPAIDPHEVLAEFPIETFLTTNYDDLMMRALRHARTSHKDPTSHTSTWWDITDDESPIDEPSDQQPLIYHLHGHWDDPASLVLTEDDYLTYLVNLVEARASGARLSLPATVLAAMTARPLLFVGYSLQDWNFRVLFHGLIRSMPINRRRRHVSVQLMPDLNTSMADADVRAQEYLERYLDGWSISIFIGDTQEFFGELRRRI
ncbi:SIR2 family NAD-dependent protein deacylase [Nonomuraea cavernae]|uniref:SIR2 family NAD-dependent protein deacylase n=1 Tax=Nonomuraea cavernae TaxID=2045107 RepID=UPI0033FD8BE8